MTTVKAVSPLLSYREPISARPTFSVHEKVKLVYGSICSINGKDTNIASDEIASRSAASAICVSHNKSVLNMWLMLSGQVLYDYVKSTVGCYARTKHGKCVEITGVAMRDGDYATPVLYVTDKMLRLDLRKVIGLLVPTKNCHLPKALRKTVLIGDCSGCKETKCDIKKFVR